MPLYLQPERVLMKSFFATLLLWAGLPLVLPAQTTTNSLVAPEAPISADTSDDAGASLLDACTHDDRGEVTTLLAAGAPVDARGKGGVTPLIVASHRDPVLVKLLLDHGAALELREDEGYTALAAACYYGNTDCASVLLAAGADVDAVNKRRHTPLMSAIVKGNDDLVKMLIDHHAEVNRESDECSAIWWAVGRDRLNEVTMLINAGADFQAHSIRLPTLNDPWFTLLSKATYTNDLDLIDLLLAHGEDINGPGMDGRTPLIIALEHAQESTVLHLLDKGADVNRADHAGMTPLMFAMEFGSPATWQALLQHGAAIGTKSNQGRTALMFAPRSGLEAVRFLLDHNAEVNDADAQGNTVLLLAENRGATDQIEFLKTRHATAPELHIIPQEMPPFPLPIEYRWYLGMSALYTQWNGLNPNVLGGGESMARSKRELLNEWKITNRYSLQNTLDHLQDTGSRYRYLAEGLRLEATPNLLFWCMTFRDSTSNNQLKAIRQNYEVWQDRTGLAGDLCRAANLVNMGFDANYISEKDAWSSLHSIAQEMQRNFTSWHEMCDNFLDAREMWTGESNPGLDMCGDLLCNSKDPNSPWNQIPWRTDLSLP